MVAVEVSVVDLKVVFALVAVLVTGELLLVIGWGDFVLVLQSTLSHTFDTGSKFKPGGQFIWNAMELEHFSNRGNQ